MGLTSSVGLGSGLDIGALVSQLVAAERAGPSAAINRREARANAQLSALGSLKGAFAALQTALSGLSSSTLFDGRTVTSSATDRLTASAGNAPVPAPGSYEIKVISKTVAHKLQSAEAAAPTLTTPLGTGTLTFTIDGESFDVVVDGDNNTIEGLAEAVRVAGAGKGVGATVIQTDLGFVLSLTATEAGTAGAIKIVQTAGGASLQDFIYDPVGSPGLGLSEKEAARDAEITIDGLTRTSSSNTFTDAISGLTLNLLKADPAETISLTVAASTASGKAALQAFVKAYNDVGTTVAKVTAFDVEKKTAAALNGDSLTRGAESQLRRALGSLLADAGSAGIDLGLKTDEKGTLSFDATKFDAAYAADPAAVNALLAGEDTAVSGHFKSFVDTLLADDGSLANRKESLERIVANTGKQREALDLRLQSVEKRYRKQFIALDSLLSQMNTTSQFLTQQLASLPAPR